MHKDLAITICSFAFLHWLIATILYKKTKFSKLSFGLLSNLEIDLMKNAAPVITLWFITLSIYRFTDLSALSFFKLSTPKAFAFTFRLTIFLIYLISNQYLLLLIKWGVKDDYYIRRNSNLVTTIPFALVMGIMSSYFFEQ